MMADRLDPVAVGVAQERRVVRRVIVAQARRTVVGAPGCDAGVPEGIDLGPPFRLETPVAAEGLVGLGAFANGEIDPVRISRSRALAIAQPIVAAANLDHFESLHDGVVEPLGRGDVGYRDGDVVEHSVGLVKTRSSTAPALRGSWPCAPLRPRAFPFPLRRSRRAR